jgi:hypothetical protein
MFGVFLLGLLLAQSSSGDSAHSSAVPLRLSASDISKLRATADHGDPDAQLALSKAYESGNGVTQDDQQAAMWCRKAAEQGNAVAQNDLGIMYREGRGVPRNKEEAVKWYRKAAYRKDPVAMFNLGAAYYNGDGVEIDDIAAYAWFALGAEAGSQSAQDALAREEAEIPHRVGEGLERVAAMLQEGTDLPKDVSAAAAWLRKAAQRDDAEAQLKLATLLVRGEGVAQNYSEAHHWCEQAAQRQVGGLYCLGFMSQQGLGVPVDLAAARQKYAQAAKMMHPAGMFAYAQMCRDGQGGKQDYVEAFFWFVMAAKEGNQQGLRAAADLEPKLTKKDRAKADNALRARNLDPQKVSALLRKGSLN